MRLYVSLVVFLLSASGARAQEQSVECDEARASCEDAMLAACPEGASIVNEQVSLRPAAEGGGKHYGIRFRCSNASADATPSPAPKVEPFTGFPEDSRPRKVAPPRAVDDRREQERDELRYLDGRIRELEVERKQYSLAGPIALVAVSGAGMALSAMRLAIARNTADLDDGSSEADVARKQAKRATIGVLACGAGAIGAFVWMGFTQRKRDATGPELKELRRRRRDLMRYGLAFDPRSRALQLSARF